jgi:hypothetical protein
MSRLSHRVAARSAMAATVMGTPYASSARSVAGSSRLGASQAARGDAHRNQAEVQPARASAAQTMAHAPSRPTRASAAAVNSSSPLPLMAAMVRKRRSRMSRRSGT